MMNQLIFYRAVLKLLVGILNILWWQTSFDRDENTEIARYKDDGFKAINEFDETIANWRKSI